jgi:hypothetical protein
MQVFCKQIVARPLLKLRGQLHSTWKIRGSLFFPSEATIKILSAWLLQDGIEKVHLWEDRRWRREPLSCTDHGVPSDELFCFTLSWAHLGNDLVTRIPGWVQISKEKAGSGRGRKVSAAMRRSDWLKPTQNCWLASLLIVQPELIEVWPKQTLVVNLCLKKKKSGLDSWK